MEECKQEALVYLKAAWEEPEPSEGESIEESNRDNEGQPGGITSPVHHSFEEALYSWAKVLKDSGESLPMANNKCQFHVVSVMYYMTIRSCYKCSVIYYTTPFIYPKLF